MTKKLVSIIIPVYKDWDRLQLCLNALSIQSLNADKFEIIVVNNDVNVDVPNFLSYPTNTKFYTEQKPGSYASRNCGIYNSTGDIIAFTDSDCIPDKDWIKNGLELIMQGYDLIGGRINIFKANPADSSIAYKFEKYFSFDQKSNVLINKLSVTANLIVRRSVFDDIGLFREDLYSGGDALWTSKATSAGYQIAYGENVVINHPARSALFEIIAKKKRLSGGFYKLEFHNYSYGQKLKFSAYALMPPIKFLMDKEIPFIERSSIFLFKWYLEYIGLKELILLNLKLENFRRV